MCSFWFKEDTSFATPNSDWWTIEATNVSSFTNWSIKKCLHLPQLFFLRKKRFKQELKWHYFWCSVIMFHTCFFFLFSCVPVSDVDVAWMNLGFWVVWGTWWVFGFWIGLVWFGIRNCFGCSLLSGPPFVSCCHLLGCYCQYDNKQ